MLATFASSAALRPSVLFAASLAIWVSQGGESLPREATRSSSLCDVALARAREAESRKVVVEAESGSGEEEEEEEEEDDERVEGVVATNVADAPRGADQAAKSAAPETSVARTRFCFDLRAISELRRRERERRGRRRGLSFRSIGFAHRVGGRREKEKTPSRSYLGALRNSLERVKIPCVRSH